MTLNPTFHPIEGALKKPSRNLKSVLNLCELPSFELGSPGKCLKPPFAESSLRNLLLFGLFRFISA